MKTLFLAMILAVTACCASANAASASFDAPFGAQTKASGNDGQATNKAATTVALPLRLVWNSNLGQNGAYALWIGGGYLVFDRVWKQTFIFVPNWRSSDANFSDEGTWVGPLPQ